MPDIESALAAKIDEALAALGKSCFDHLSRSQFSTAWAEATALSAAAVGAHVAGTEEQTRLQINELYKSGALFAFANALAAMDPPPHPDVRAAVRTLQMATMIDLERWEALDSVRRQAILTIRDAYLNSIDLLEFFQNAWPRICCIVGRAEWEEGIVQMSRQIGGTGFLVGPDLIITSAHVIEPLLDPKTGAARDETHKQFCVFFDHFGNHKIDLDLECPGALKVPPHMGWLVDRSPSSSGNSEIDKCFDYALVRLSYKVGEAARNRRYGAPRGWVSVPDSTDEDIVNLVRDMRLAIPQHPNQHGLVLDIGRVRGPRVGIQSRVLYAVNTSPGSSGAPVLASGGKLVALHEGNAPGGQGDEDANQGIRISAFNGALTKHLPPPFDHSKVLERWCIGGSRQEPLIGRSKFIEWVEQSYDGKTPPICVVTGDRKSGKSFTAKILVSLVGWRGDPVVVFRSVHEEIPEALDGVYAMPARPDGFVAVLAKELGLDASTAPPEPPRPEIVVTDLGEASARDLKPDNWASKDLPHWLVRAVEAKLAAKSMTHVWVVFDMAPDAQLGLLLREFLCAATKPADKASVLARFRWVFLGFDPDFIAGEKCWEKLDPATEISEEDLERLVGAAFAAAGRDIPSQFRILFRRLLDAYRSDRLIYWSNVVALCIELIQDVLPDPGASQ